MTEKPDYMQMAREGFAHFHDAMDTEALIRWREHALEGCGHDTAEVNKNSLRRIITRLDRAETALDTERTAHEATNNTLVNACNLSAEFEARAEKAEAELQALRQVVEWAVGELPSNFDGVIASLRQFLPQPAADPLDQVLESLPANFGNCVDGATALREALARHGLTITEKQGCES
jgi:hypothetical protein